MDDAWRCAAAAVAAAAARSRSTVTAICQTTQIIIHYRDCCVVKETLTRDIELDRKYSGWQGTNRRWDRADIRTDEMEFDY